MTDHVKMLAEKMDRDGFTIPGKNLTNPVIAEEILKSLDRIALGFSAPMSFNDSQRIDGCFRPIICECCEKEIPYLETYLYKTNSDGYREPYHDRCYKWPDEPIAK